MIEYKSKIRSLPQKKTIIKSTRNGKNLRKIIKKNILNYQIKNAIYYLMIVLSVLNKNIPVLNY